MTEAEWLACADPRRMLDHLRGRVSDRRLRLFVCACCRGVWHLLTDPRSRRAVVELEADADGEPVSFGFLARAGDVSQEWHARYQLSLGDELPAEDRARWNASDAVMMLADSMTTGLPEHPGRFFSTLRRAELLAAGEAPHSDAALCPGWAAPLLRDVVSNPFRPAAFDPDMLTPIALPLARAAYEGRADDGALDPVRLAVLADCLEEAGCDDALTAVLREPGPKFRGLWPLDLVLGKE